MFLHNNIFCKNIHFLKKIEFISHSYFSWSLFFISSASLSFIWASWSSLNRVVTWRFNVSTSLPTCHSGNPKHAHVIRIQTKWTFLWENCVNYHCPTKTGKSITILTINVANIFHEKKCFSYSSVSLYVYIY